jgi:hypothetical protein
MAVTKKIFKGRFLKGIKTDHILGILALIFVAVLLLNYSIILHRSFSIRILK